ncbi:MAG TPA: flagellar hook capping FlgD N-terminal domain-containing protein [Candidatus Acidoferrales bacterium]|nr:flagellar hook capping FlgD N-terminal domain-containing protein [Candidatus Acidoferrales bacterium]
MNVTNPILAQPADSGTSSSTGLPSSQGLNNMFLQLLVAQLQNQDPLDPMDPTQFVGQLAQFSELSEVTQIEQLLEQVIPSNSTTGTASATSDPAKANALSSAATTSPAATAPGRANVPEASSLTTPIFNHQIQGVF